MEHADPIPIKLWDPAGLMPARAVQPSSPVPLRASMGGRRKAGGHKRRGGGGKLHAQADGQKRDNKRVKATPPC